MSKGYVNGSDVLFMLEGVAPGHCSSHNIDYSAETKQHAVKPAVTAGSDEGLWQDSVVTGLSFTGQAEGFIYDDEAEMSVAALRRAWLAAEPVEMKAFHRGSQEKPYLVAQVLITSVSEKHPAREDATYTVNFQNCGKPSVFEPESEK